VVPVAAHKNVTPFKARAEDGVAGNGMGWKRILACRPRALALEEAALTQFKERRPKRSESEKRGWPEGKTGGGDRGEKEGKKRERKSERGFGRSITEAVFF